MDTTTCRRETWRPSRCTSGLNPTRSGIPRARARRCPPPAATHLDSALDRTPRTGRPKATCKSNSPQTAAPGSDTNKIDRTARTTLLRPASPDTRTGSPRHLTVPRNGLRCTTARARTRTPPSKTSRGACDAPPRARTLAQAPSNACGRAATNRLGASTGTSLGFPSSCPMRFACAVDPPAGATGARLPTRVLRAFRRASHDAPPAVAAVAARLVTAEAEREARRAAFRRRLRARGGRIRPGWKPPRTARAVQLRAGARVERGRTVARHDRPASSAAVEIDRLAPALARDVVAAHPGILRRIAAGPPRRRVDRTGRRRRRRVAVGAGIAGVSRGVARLARRATDSTVASALLRHSPATRISSSTSWSPSASRFALRRFTRMTGPVTSHVRPPASRTPPR